MRGHREISVYDATVKEMPIVSICSGLSATPISFRATHSGPARLDKSALNSPKSYRAYKNNTYEAIRVIQIGFRALRRPLTPDNFAN